MNPTDAKARQRSIREGQVARARLVKGEPVDEEAVIAVQETDGVPARYCGIKANAVAPKGSGPRNAISKSLVDMMTPVEGVDGLIIYGRTKDLPGRMAGALYYGAMMRSRGAKWYNFSELADGYTRRISIDKNNEWDVGEMRDFLIDLDSSKFCYDLVVIHDVVASAMTSYIGQELYKLIAARTIRGLFTVLTARIEDAADLWGNSTGTGYIVEESFAVFSESARAGR